AGGDRAAVRSLVRPWRDGDRRSGAGGAARRAPAPLAELSAPLDPWPRLRSTGNGEMTVPLGMPLDLPAAGPAVAAITVRALDVHLPDAQRWTRPLRHVLRGVTFGVPRGQVTALVGTNGA